MIRPLLIIALLAPIPSAPAADTFPEGGRHGSPAGPAAANIALLESEGPLAEGLARGAAEAVVELNKAGLPSGARLRLVKLPRSRNPWHDGAPLMAKLAYEHDVVAMIGPSERSAAHLAAQIATKKRVPVLALASEKALTRVMDPWIFRGVPEDSAQARAVLRRALTATRTHSPSGPGAASLRGGRRGDPKGAEAVLVVPAGREGRERLQALQEACSALDVSVAQVVRFAPGSRPAESHRAPTHFQKAPGAAALPGSTPRRADVLLLWLDPGPALSLLDGSRERLSGVTLLGSLRLDAPAFRDAAPSWAKGMFIPRLRSGKRGLGEALGYDMVKAIALAGASQGGLEPELIRDGLLQGRPLHGRSGRFRFDEYGNRAGPVPVGRLWGTGKKPEKHGQVR